MNNRTTPFCVLAILTLELPLSAANAVEFPGPQPGKAVALVESQQFHLQNAAIQMSWLVSEGRLRPGSVTDRLSEKGMVQKRGLAPSQTSASARKRRLGEVPVPVLEPCLENELRGSDEVFTVHLTDGRTISSSNMKMPEPPRIENLPADARALRASCRHPGKCVSAKFISADGTLRVQWRAVLRDGDNYIRQELTLCPQANDLPLAEITLGKWSADGAKTVSSVRGSPVLAGNLFFACESPLADNRVAKNSLFCSLPWKSPIRAGQTFSCASVVGVAPKAQLRRAFLCYVERERARPYQPFLHYNSWYDMREMDEQKCVSIIDVLCRELVQKRGVRLDSIVLDDGWDDPQMPWAFRDGFPNGFTPLRIAAERCGSAIGVWLSPFGGYGEKDKRLKFGKKQGFEVNSRGLALAGPKYYAFFRDTCRTMIEKYGVNYFKFDGFAAGLEYERSTPADLADITAVLRLAEELRQMRPDVYLSLTTGTWPSPYWLWCGDSIWRNGNDADFCGEGSRRQRWMNYRDAITQQMVVRRGPLFPLNSLMNQGIMHAQLGIAAQLDNDLKGVIDDLRMFFGSGTQLQELYITPKRLTPEMWDALAEAAAWSRRNADVLVDTHWIGGDAGKGEPYGYASWSPRKGILCARNPSSKPKTLTIKLADAFELPQNASQRYRLKSPWKADAQMPARTVAATTEYRINLHPFEVSIQEATPKAD